MSVGELIGVGTAPGVLLLLCDEKDEGELEDCLDEELLTTLPPEYLMAIVI